MKRKNRIIQTHINYDRNYTFDNSTYQTPAEKSSHKNKKLKVRSDENDLNLLKMVLNLQSNSIDDKDKIYTLFDTFINIKQMEFSPEFINSLNNSRNIFEDAYNAKSHILDLNKDSNDSFLIFPVRGYGHLIGGIIRKTYKGYRVTLINKGLRFYHDNFEEHIFKKENTEKLFTVLKKVGLRKNSNIEDIYKTFENNADSSYILKLFTGDQKVGNCYCKNIEAAIKFAYSTSNFSKIDFKDLRRDSFNYENIDNNFKKHNLKWGKFSTKKVHKLFCDELIKNNPNLKEVFLEQYDIYQKNKTFREKIKNGYNSPEDLLHIFQQSENFVDIDISIDKKNTMLLTEMLKKISSTSLFDNIDEIKKIVDYCKCSQLKNKLNSLIEKRKILKNCNDNKFFEFYMDANINPIKSFDDVFVPDKDKHLPLNQRIEQHIHSLNTKILKEKSFQIKEILDCLGKDTNAIYKDLLKNASEKYKEFKYNFKNMKDELKNLQETFPIAVEKLDEIVESIELERMSNCKTLHKIEFIHNGSFGLSYF